MRVIVDLGMINIDGVTFSYSNIENMYKTGHGFGLQLDEHVEHKRDEITQLCHEVTDKLYELARLTKE